MTRIDRDMQVGEALWILGYRDVKDFDALMRDAFKKYEPMADTEGWSNRQLNERIQLLEGRLTDLLLRFKGKQELIDTVKEWAYTMGLMYEDCAYLSHEAFEKDAKAALATLVERVGKWTPPEMRGK